MTFDETTFLTIGIDTVTILSQDATTITFIPPPSVNSPVTVNNVTSASAPGTVFSPATLVPSLTGRARAKIRASSASNCSRSRMLRRRRWKGLLTCRSWMAFFHSNVDPIGTCTRRSFRKYSSSSNGMATAAAMAAVVALRNWGKKFTISSVDHPGAGWQSRGAGLNPAARARGGS